VDLGRSYSISQLRIWTRNDCCLTRNANVVAFVGDSSRSYIYDTVFMPLRTLTTPTLGAPTIINNVATGRFVTIFKANLAGGDASFLSLCEVQVFAQKLANQPSPVVAFASEQFRGNLVIVGGTSPAGFRTPAVRFFNVDKREWAPAFTPLGTGPGARGASMLALMDSTRLLTYGGASNGGVMSDMSLLIFPDCPAFNVYDSSILSFQCYNGGTACIFTCQVGFSDQNAGAPVVCREDGLVDGVLPPCLSLSIASAPIAMTAVADAGNTSVAVTWQAPSITGPYPLLSFTVTATPVQFIETFALPSGFADPSVWRVWNTTLQSSSTYFFKDGRLWIDAGSGTDTWAGLTTTGTWTATPYPGSWTGGTGIITVNEPATRNSYVLFRDWPATIDAWGEWAMETDIVASAMVDASGMWTGLMDMGLNQGKGEIQVWLGIRYTDGAFGGTYTINFGTNGGRMDRVFAALGNQVYFRLEKFTGGASFPGGRDAGYGELPDP